MIDLFGYGALLIIAAMSWVARRYNTGPLWLRQFKIEKSTLF
jgi:hypothetical protein